MTLVAAGGVLNLGILLSGRWLKPHQVTNGLLVGLTVMVGGLAYLLRRKQLTEREHRLL
jgi:LPXTG-motif cell wall-anchored protein